MSILEAPIVNVPAYSAAYNARLERLGAFSAREKADEAYRRRFRLPSQRVLLARSRENRRLARVCRENEAIKARHNALYLRMQSLRQARYTAIRERVIAERKIRPPGKSVKSIRRYNGLLFSALMSDPGYVAFRTRCERVDLLLEWTRGRGRYNLAAGILASDDRKTRHAKMRAWREGRGEP